jgi:tetrahydromethanopterin S-methyltransferase subunit G
MNTDEKERISGAINKGFGPVKMNLDELKHEIDALRHDLEQLDRCIERIEGITSKQKVSRFDNVIAWGICVGWLICLLLTLLSVVVPA